MLREVKEHLREVAEAWVKTATRKKGIPTGSPLEGEEWLAGPAALMDGCNQFIHTLSLMEGKKFLDRLPVRTLAQRPDGGDGGAEFDLGQGAVHRPQGRDLDAARRDQGQPGREHRVGL